MRILVLHPGALGDIILSLPALNLVRTHFPAAEITFAANLDFATVVCHSYADKFLSLSTLPLHRLHGSQPLSAEDLRFWRSYDRVHSWTGSGDPEFARKLAAANPSTSIGSWKPTDWDPRHVSQIFVDTLRPWVTVPEDIPVPKICLREHDRQSGEEWLGANSGDPFVALHPGAGGPAKRWRPEKFRVLVRELSRSYTKNLMIIEGPAERGLARLIGSPEANVKFAEELSLGPLAGALSRCRAYIGHDSGISHLAAGLGVPSVILFGPTSPVHWSPRGEHVTILHDPHGGLEDISVDDCISALQNVSVSSVSPW